MAIINSYATLQTAVGDYLARSDLSTFLPNFVQNCEGKLYKNLRIRAMETALSGTISSGVLAVPSDYVELKYAYINSTPVRALERVPVEQIYSEYPVRSGAEYPRYIAREGSNFIFGPYPGDHGVVGIYYARFAALSGSNTTNWFTTNAPDVLLYGALLEAEPFIKNDARLILWKSMYDNAVQAIMDEEKREGRSGSAPRIRAQ
jgi:hypothetical protein